MAVELRRLRPGEEKRLGKTMSAAFFNDPLTEFMVPDEETRMAKGQWFFEKAAAYCARWGEVYTNDDLSGEAAWLTSGNTTMSMMRLIRSGFWQMPFRMGFGASSRFNKIDSAATPVHKKHVPGDHWYLLGLGTHPDYQKSGLGSAAINIGAAKAAKAGLPIYLETMTQENVDYYSRRGFRVVEELPIEDKLTIWAMVLDPEKSVRAGS